MNIQFLDTLFHSVVKIKYFFFLLKLGLCLLLGHGFQQLHPEVTITQR